MLTTPQYISVLSQRGTSCEHLSTFLSTFHILLLTGSFQLLQWLLTALQFVLDYSMSLTVTGTITDVRFLEQFLMNCSGAKLFEYHRWHVRSSLFFKLLLSTTNSHSVWLYTIEIHFYSIIYYFYYNTFLQHIQIISHVASLLSANKLEYTSGILWQWQKRSLIRLYQLVLSKCLMCL